MPTVRDRVGRHRDLHHTVVKKKGAAIRAPTGHRPPNMHDADSLWNENNL